MVKDKRAQSMANKNNSRLIDMVISVKDFGAIADANYLNTSDDSYYSDATFTKLATNNAPSLQRAMEYLISNGGGTLFFPKGNYFVSSTVYINPSTPIPITLCGVLDKRAIGTGGSNIVCGTSKIFCVNVDSAGKQVIGFNYAGYEGFEVKKLGFTGVKTAMVLAGDASLSEYRNTYLATTVFTLHGVRFKIHHCNTTGVTRFINQPHDDASTPVNANYSDFVYVGHISSRDLQDQLITLSRCDVSVVEFIHLERSSPTVGRVIDIFCAQEIAIRNIHSSMHYWQGASYVPKTYSSMVYCESCNGVNISDVYCERQYYYEGMICLGYSYNVHIDNIGEVGLDTTKPTYPLLSIRKSDVSVNGVHSTTIRKSGYGDFVALFITGSNLKLENIDIRNLVNGQPFGTSPKRFAYIQGANLIDYINYVDLKFLDFISDGTNYTILDKYGADVTSVFTAPTYSTDGILLTTSVTINGIASSTSPLIRMRYIPSKLLIGTGISYDTVEVLRNDTTLKFGFFSNAGVRITPIDAKCSFRAHIA